MKCQEKAEISILPVEIGYFGKPLSRLSRDELLDAILKLSIMYMEAQRKLDNYKKVGLRQKDNIKSADHKTAPL